MFKNLDELIFGKENIHLFFPDLINIENVCKICKQEGKMDIALKITKRSKDDYLYI